MNIRSANKVKKNKQTNAKISTPDHMPLHTHADIPPDSSSYPEHHPPQIAVIEFARNVLSMTDANSTEFQPATPHPVVVFMPEVSTTHMGGTMRLGARRTVLQTVGSISSKLYQSDMYIDERHRHRCVSNDVL